MAVLTKIRDQSITVDLIRFHVVMNAFTTPSVEALRKIGLSSVDAERFTIEGSGFRSGNRSMGGSLYWYMVETQDDLWPIISDRANRIILKQQRRLIERLIFQYGENETIYERPSYDRADIGSFERNRAIFFSEYSNPRDKIKMFILAGDFHTGSIKIENGTLSMPVKSFLTLASIYSAILGYGSLRSSIDYILNDSLLVKSVIAEIFPFRISNFEDIPLPTDIVLKRINLAIKEDDEILNHYESLNFKSFS